MSQEFDAHVVDKCRIEGDRHGQRRFYLVGPTRARADEALRDLRAYQEGDQVRDDLETAVSLLQRRRINGTITPKEARFLDRLRAEGGGS